MITKQTANSLRNQARKCVYHGEDFAAAVVRANKEITDSASSGSDGLSLVCNPSHVRPLIAILRELGFSANENTLDKFRVDIDWQ